MDLRWWSSSLFSVKAIDRIYRNKIKIQSSFCFLSIFFSSNGFNRIFKSFHLLLIVEKDDWVTESVCENLVTNLFVNNVDIGFIVYGNTHHEYDRRGMPLKYENGYATGNCHFRMRSDGSFIMNFLDIRMITPLLQKVGLGW